MTETRMDWIDALDEVQNQAHAGHHKAIVARPLGGFRVMDADEYDRAPGNEVHPFSLAHDTRRSDEENRLLFFDACMWQRGTFEDKRARLRIARRVEMYMPIRSHNDAHPGT